MRTRSLLFFFLSLGLCLSAEARSWTNTQGKVVQAHYLTSDAKTVTLVVVDKNNKYIKEVTLDKVLFSDEDKAYIEEQEVLLTIPAYDEMGIKRGVPDKSQSKKWQFKLQ